MTPTPSANLPHEASPDVMRLIQQILAAYSKGTALYTLARRVEIHIQVELNQQLELLAGAILSYSGVEESVPVRAAVSRGSVEQVVTNTAYEARRCFAELTRSMKTPVITMGRKRKTSTVDFTCNGKGDAVEVTPDDEDEREDSWWAQIESDADLGSS